VVTEENARGDGEKIHLDIVRDRQTTTIDIAPRQIESWLGPSLCFWTDRRFKFATATPGPCGRLSLRRRLRSRRGSQIGTRTGTCPNMGRRAPCSGRPPIGSCAWPSTS
jgi:hypothetical protein